jgi:hypothetical protein
MASSCFRTIEINKMNKAIILKSIILGHLYLEKYYYSILENVINIFIVHGS